MNVEHHLIKIKRLETTLAKLNEEEDYEAVLELYMLIAAHYLNAALSYAMKQLDDMRPSHIYGRGENGNSAKKAKEHYLFIKTTCEGMLHA